MGYRPGQDVGYRLLRPCRPAVPVCNVVMVAPGQGAGQQEFHFPRGPY